MTVTDREKAINLIDSIPDSQMRYIISMLQSFKAAVDEASDDSFCEHLYENYLNDTDSEKDNGIPIETFAHELGINL